MTRKSRKRRLVRSSRVPPGSPPGTLIGGDPSAPASIVRILGFAPEGPCDVKAHDIEELKEVVGRYPFTWVDVIGLEDTTTIEKVGKVFGLHRLALEDVHNTRQRAKVEQYDGYLFIVIHLVTLTDQLQTEQIGIFLGKDFVVTFQERAGDDPLERARTRLCDKGNGGRAIRPDYLVYTILDSATDGYFPVLEKYGELLEDLEDEIVAKPTRATVARIHEIKRELLMLRRTIWPQREALNSLYRDETPLISKETRVYLRDCYDHTIMIIDLVETYREVGADMMDVYLSSISNRMNEIMKVLTIISTIFIPLTFISGLYGMNFNTEYRWNMPELNWPFGYPLVLVIMAAVTICQLLFFRRKGWIGPGSRDAAAKAINPEQNGKHPASEPSKNL